VEPRQEVKSISAEDTFPEDLALDELGPALDLAAERVWTAAERQGKLGRTVTLKLKTAQFRVLTRRLTPPGPPASAAELAALARELAARVELPAATRYRLAGVGLSGFGAEDDAEPAQSVLFDDAREAPES
jgi:DNA polymerase-4